MTPHDSPAGPEPEAGSDPEAGLDPEVVKRASELFLEDFGLRPADLPIIEPGPGRGQNEIVERALIANGLVHVSCGAPVERVADWIAAQKLVHALTDSERALLVKEDDEITEEEKVQFSWSIEALFALLWAGGLCPTLDLDEEIPDDLALLCPDLASNEKSGKFIKRFRLRPYRELFGQLDLYYRAHGAISAEEQPEPTFPGPVELDEDALLERRKALEWVLCPEFEWESPEMDL